MQASCVVTVHVPLTQQRPVVRQPIGLLQDTPWSATCNRKSPTAVPKPLTRMQYVAPGCEQKSTRDPRDSVPITPQPDGPSSLPPTQVRFPQAPQKTLIFVS